MKVYLVTAVVKTAPQVFLERRERMIAGGWRELLETLAQVSRDTSYVFTAMRIEETEQAPFGWQTDGVAIEKERLEQ